MRSPRTATKSSPRSPQLEKAHAQQRRPDAAKNKYVKKKKKKGKCSLELHPQLASQQDRKLALEERATCCPAGHSLP